MTFLAPAWLLLLALVGVVVALHARRRRRIAVASVRLWQLIETSAVQRRALRRPPISLALLLQVLIVTGAALALAQPRIGWGADSPAHTVFILDTSASMQAQDGAGTRFDAAIRRLTGEVRAIAGNGGRVSVIAAGAPATIAVARQADAAGILAILDSLRPGDGSADWNGAAAWIAPVLRSDEGTQVAVLTDSAGAEAVQAAIEAANPGVALRVEAFGTPVANASLIATVEPVEDSPGKWSITGTVAISAGATPPAEIAVAFQRDGTETGLDFGAIVITAAETPGEPATFTSEMELPGPGRLTLSLPPDGAAYDNRANFVLGDASPVRVLFLGRQDPEILRALAAVGDVEIFTSAGEGISDADFDLVVVNDTAVDRAPATNVLWFGRGRVGPESEPPPLLGDLTGWNTEHILSRDLAWTALATPRGFAVPRLSGATILAESRGLPLVQARTVPTGREVRVALDPVASGWVSDPSFPVFVGNVVGWLNAETRPAPPPCIAGAACPLPARLAGRAVTGPDGGVARGALTGQWTAPGAETFVPATAGFYRIAGPGTPYFLAVNASTELPGGATGAAASPGLSGFLPSLWWMLAAVVLGLLLIEAWIAGRGSERFLRRDALRPTMPHSGRRRVLLGLRVAAVVAVVATLFSLPFPERRPAEIAVVVAGATGGPGGDVSGEEGSAADGVGRVSAAGKPAIMADIGGTIFLPAAPLPGDNLEAAVELALAMIPGDRRGRVVVATDGNETAGAVGRVQSALLLRETPLDLAPVPGLPQGEVLVETVAAPTHVRVGESFPVHAILLSAAATEALVTVLRNGERLIEQPVALVPGRNRTEVLVPPAVEAGLATIEFAVVATGDVVPQNNRSGISIQVAGPPAILIVTPEAGAGGVMADALGVQGLEAEVMGPDDTPWYMEDWLRYDVVVLMNVPAIDLDSRKQSLVEDLVRIHGRGLLILGGEHAFGPGGYFRTPLEQLSPLSSRVPQDAPRAAMVYVLDRSGSMQGRVEDATRLDIAKEATLGAIELLHEDSQVGVIVFDTEPHVIVPLHDRKDEAAIAAALAPLVPGGGTELYPALALAIEELRDVNSEARHIVVMSDGLLEPADFAGLLAEATAAGITVSAVAVGSAADQRLEAVARLGGGAFHATRDFKALPSILSQEALMLAGDPVEQGVRDVFWVDRDPALFAGLPEVMPPIQNYVPTTLQPTASLHLAVRNDDDETVPILASWRHGNGRVLALATHGAGSGTARWMSMPEYPLLWAQAVRNLLPGGGDPGLAVSASRSGDAIVVVADVLDSSGDPVTGAAVTATRSDGAGPIIELVEETPGRYRGALPVQGDGLQRARVSAGDQSAEVETFVGYPAAYDFGRADIDAAIAVATATGGILTADADGTAPAKVWVAAPAWRPWLVAMLVLLTADLVIRYAPGLLGLGARRRSRLQVTTAKG